MILRVRLPSSQTARIVIERTPVTVKVLREEIDDKLRSLHLLPETFCLSLNGKDPLGGDYDDTPLSSVGVVGGDLIRLMQRRPSDAVAAPQVCQAPAPVNPADSAVNGLAACAAAASAMDVLLEDNGLMQRRPSDAVAAAQVCQAPAPLNPADSAANGLAACAAAASAMDVLLEDNGLVKSRKYMEAKGCLLRMGFLEEHIENVLVASDGDLQVAIEIFGDNMQTGAMKGHSEDMDVIESARPDSDDDLVDAQSSSSSASVTSAESTCNSSKSPAPISSSALANGSSKHSHTARQFPSPVEPSSVVSCHSGDKQTRLVSLHSNAKISTVREAGRVVLLWVFQEMIIEMYHDTLEEDKVLDSMCDVEYGESSLKLVCHLPNGNVCELRHVWMPKSPVGTLLVTVALAGHTGLGPFKSKWCETNFISFDAPLTGDPQLLYRNLSGAVSATEASIGKGLSCLFNHDLRFKQHVFALPLEVWDMILELLCPKSIARLSSVSHFCYCITERLRSSPKFQQHATNVKERRRAAGLPYPHMISHARREGVLRRRPMFPAEAINMRRQIRRPSSIADFPRGF